LFFFFFLFFRVQKIFLETPRARVTLLLAHHHEGLSKVTPPTPESKKSLETASDLLSELQVETYSSMERREKTEFILEQMRLLIALAQQKDADKSDADGAGGGEAEWVKARVSSRKVSEAFLKEKENEVRLILAPHLFISCVCDRIHRI
jgi:26S proteasome regulatory subunit N5